MRIYHYLTLNGLPSSIFGWGRLKMQMSYVCSMLKVLCRSQTKLKHKGLNVHFLFHGSSLNKSRQSIMRLFREIQVCLLVCVYWNTCLPFFSHDEHDAICLKLCFLAALVCGSHQWQEVYKRFINATRNHPIEVIFGATKEEDTQELYSRYCYDFVHKLSLSGTNEDCTKV